MKPFEIGLDIDVSIFQKDGCFLAYAPAFNLSTYGDSEEDVINAFQEALHLFIDTMAERGTLNEALLDLGWRLQKLPTPKYQPKIKHKAPSGLARKGFKKIETEKMNVSVPV